MYLGDKEASRLFENAFEQLRRKRWIAAHALFVKLQENYEAESKDVKLEPGYRAYLVGVSHLADTFALLAEVFQAFSDERLDEALERCRRALDSLRNASSQFRSASVHEDEQYCLALMESLKASFYEIHSLRQLEAYNLEKAGKYLRTAVETRREAFQLHNELMVRLLFTQGTAEAQGKLKEELARRQESMRILQQQFEELRVEAQALKKQLSLQKTEANNLASVRETHFLLIKKIRTLRPLLIGICGITVAYLALDFGLTAHVFSIIDVGLLLIAALAFGAISFSLHSPKP